MTDKEYFERLHQLDEEIYRFIDESDIREGWKNQMRIKWRSLHYDAILYGNYEKDHREVDS